MKTGERACVSQSDLWRESICSSWTLFYRIPQANGKASWLLHLAHCRYLVGNLILSVYGWNVYISWMAVWKFWGSCKFLLLFLFRAKHEVSGETVVVSGGGLGKSPTGKCAKSTHHWRHLPSSGEDTHQVGFQPRGKCCVLAEEDPSEKKHRVLDSVSWNQTEMELMCWNLIEGDLGVLTWGVRGQDAG